MKWCLGFVLLLSACVLDALPEQEPDESIAEQSFANKVLYKPFVLHSSQSSSSSIKPYSSKSSEIYTLTVNVTGKGKLNRFLKNHFVHGDSIDIKAIPLAGYGAANVTINGLAIAYTQGYRFPILKNTVIQVQFPRLNHRVKVESSSLAILNHKQAVLEHGKDFKVGLRNLKEGYEFSHFFLDKPECVSQIKNTTLQGILCPVTARVIFKLKDYHVQIKSSEHGQSTFEGMLQRVHGSRLELSPKAQKGYKFQSIVLQQDTCAQVKDSVIYNIRCPLQAEVLFTPQTYPVVVIDPNGNASRTYQMLAGSQLVLRSNSKAGYQNPKAQIKSLGYASIPLKFVLRNINAPDSIFISHEPI